MRLLGREITQPTNLHKPHACPYFQAPKVVAEIFLANDKSRVRVRRAHTRTATTAATDLTRARLEIGSLRSSDVSLMAGMAVT